MTFCLSPLPGHARGKVAMDLGLGTLDHDPTVLGQGLTEPIF